MNILDTLNITTEEIYEDKLDVNYETEITKEDWDSVSIYEVIELNNIDKFSNISLSKFDEINNWYKVITKEFFTIIKDRKVNGFKISNEHYFIFKNGYILKLNHMNLEDFKTLTISLYKNYKVDYLFFNHSPIVEIQNKLIELYNEI